MPVSTRTGGDGTVADKFFDAMVRKIDRVVSSCLQ
jgi:hypothetical protein